MSRNQIREGKHGIGVQNATLGMVTLHENRHTRRMVARLERKRIGVVISGQGINKPLPVKTEE